MHNILPLVFSMEESKSDLQHVKARILELEAEIKEAKDEAKKAGNNDKKERDYWRSKEAQLQDRLNVLLKKEERLEGASAAPAADPSLLRRIDAIELGQRLTADPTLALFDGISGCGSSRLSEGTKNTCKRVFKDSCLICEKPASDLQVPLTVAQIIPGDKEKLNSFARTAGLLESLGPPKYPVPLELRSVRNVLSLCGTKDTRGTCHWAFDNHLCAIVRAGLKSEAAKFQIIWLDPTNRTDQHLADADLQDYPLPTRYLRTPESFKPYLRALGLHAKKSLSAHQHVIRTSHPTLELDALCDFMEFSATIRDGEDETNGESSVISSNCGMGSHEP